MLEKGQLLELYLFIDALLRLQPPPIAEAIEKVRAAALRLLGYGVKAAADAVIQLLLAQRPYLGRKLCEAPVYDIHSITLPLKHIAACGGIFA